MKAQKSATAGKACSAAPQSENILITFKRIPLGKSGVRLQFFIHETGKKWCAVDFQTKFMAIIDREAKRLRMNAGQFIFHAVKHQLPALEKSMQEQGRAA